MEKKNSTVYLVPSLLYEQATETIPPYVISAIKECSVFFVENERSARRYLKSVWKEIVIDDYKWIPIHKAEETVRNEFRQSISRGETIGIISEAGCPGIADPGQVLVAEAHLQGAHVRPLVGPSSILLALMASGMNGQQFQFSGYLPIDVAARQQAIKTMEEYSSRNNCTMVFIETPYRNNQLLESLIKNCHANTRLCIAVSITSPQENILTKTIGEWKRKIPHIPKEPAIFCLHRQ